jgi:hypothetical protein
VKERTAKRNGKYKRKLTSHGEYAARTVAFMLASL